MTARQIIPCLTRIDRYCFKANPQWARQAFAYRLLHTIAPKEVTRRLPKRFASALVGAGATVPAGVDIPPGMTVAPGAEMPAGWTEGDPAPGGALPPPEGSTVVVGAGGSGGAAPFDWLGLMGGAPTPSPPPAGCSFVWWANEGSLYQAITSTGGHIYQAAYEGATSSIYKKTLGGVNVDDFEINGPPQGLGNDGTYLYTSDINTGDLEKWQLDGTFIETLIYAQDFPPYDITFDGTYFWTVDSSGPHLLRWASDWSTSTTFSNVSTAPRGITWDGSNLWISDINDDNLYKLDADCDIIDTVSALTGGVNSLAWDGSCLWASDSVADTTSRMTV